MFKVPNDFFFSAQYGGFAIFNKLVVQFRPKIVMMYQVNTNELVEPYKEMAWLFAHLVGHESMTYMYTYGLQHLLYLS